MATRRHASSRNPAKGVQKVRTGAGGRGRGRAGAGGMAAAGLGLAGGARADGHCGNATMASTAQAVPDLSTLVQVVGGVARDESQAEKAGPFLEAIQDATTANVTAFAPVNSAFETLFTGNATFDPAEVLMFHAVGSLMEEGESYDTLAGAAAGQLTVNGDEVEGPCNTAKVAQTVQVCDSVVHVVESVLLPAEFCVGASEEDTGKEDYTDGGSGDDAEESNDDSAEDGGDPSEDDAGDDEDDSGNDGGEESADDAGDDEDDSGNDGGEESADDGGDGGDGEDAD